MAGYQCVGCDGEEQATVLVTPLSGAETMAIGPNCMAPTWCGFLAGVLGVDADQLWTAAEALRTAKADAEDQDQAPASPPESGAESPPGELAGKAAGGPQAGPRSSQAAKPRRPRAQASRSGEEGS